MASRSLTEVFILMRNNAMHTRQMFFEQNGDSERVHLMHSGSSRDIESGGELRGDRAPPPWTDTLEEAHYIISRLRSKISELQTHHERQIARPSLDDTTHQLQIERIAADISRQFGNAHRNCSAIKAQTRVGTKTDQKLANNVVLALVTTLQELSVIFRTAQSNYLKTLTSREERSNAYFDLPNFEELSLNDNDFIPGLNSNQTDLLFSLPSTSGYKQNSYIEDETLNDAFEKRSQNQKQLLLIQEENTKMVAEREQEVNSVVKSIVDLNDIFKDLSSMVHDQGTVLDRIDYNIEQTSYQVHEGYTQLKKAEQYQKSNRKMKFIMILAAVIIVMCILLILVKS